MKIRSETPADAAAISSVITAAFLLAEHSDGNEARIVEALREAGSLTVSLVATEGDRIVGHVAFSPVTIDGRSDGWLGLGPVAVVPDRQRHGIGSALIEAGLAQLRIQGSRGCVVLGEPGYYRRFGFAADPEFRLAGVPPEYFQRLIFQGPCDGGLVEYHHAFEIG
ncbi:MAG: N-acetyltransferase [Sphingomonas sp.]|nr:N-acetyltransferase [Sphingomonas sp.]